MPQPISITLIMAALDAEAYVADALASVSEQEGALEDVEVVVADGGSRDCTREIAERFPFTRLLPDGDKGIYQGMNRGLAAAKGEIVGFLNSDDRLATDALQVIRAYFSASPNPDFISGAITFDRMDSGHLRGDRRVFRHTEPMSVAGLLFGVPAINGRFFRSTLLNDIGGFRPEVGLAADREFLLRILKSGARSVPTEKVLYHYRVHIESKTLAENSESRMRIWQGEMQLAAYLEQARILGDDDTPWVNLAGTLANLRHTIKSGRSRSGTFSYKRLWRDWPQLMPALRTWYHWRARLSGY